MQLLKLFLLLQLQDVLVGGAVEVDIEVADELRGHDEDEASEAEEETTCFQPRHVSVDSVDADADADADASHFHFWFFFLQLFCWWSETRKKYSEHFEFHD